jgi:hypothetical protein
MAKTESRQSSNKAGLKSLGKKLDNSRYGFAAQPASRKKAGAFGAERGRRGTARPQQGTATPKPGKASALRRVK